MSTSLSTNQQVSPDSGEIWTMPGAWPVARGLYRVPLPLPSDSLKAVNVYLLEGPDGLDLIDGGWAVDSAQDTLRAALRTLGYGVGDIRRFLVTHVHRDHYTLARVVASEHGAVVVLGRDELAGLRVARGPEKTRKELMSADLVAAGAPGLAAEWLGIPTAATDDDGWADPDVWLEGDGPVAAGRGTLDALHTPGHTAGHYVYADMIERHLFAGDHVLPTITPSIGFESPRARDPLGNFLRSLAKVRGLPDMMVLPAHGPLAASAHHRVDALLEHHEDRLAQSLAALSSSPATAHQVAGRLAWTRRELHFEAMDVFNRALATLETSAHLEVLVARGRAVASPGGAPTYYQTAETASRPTT